MKKLSQIISIVNILLFAQYCFAQKDTHTNILTNIWELQNEKFKEYKTYLFFDNNKIFRYEMYNNKLTQADEKDFFLNDIYYISDSTLSQFSDKITDNELASYFNHNPNTLLKDLKLDFSKKRAGLNAVHFTKNADTITNAHIWSYQFYDKLSFNQYGYGWTPGQPQIGYIYKVATNVPKLVSQEVLKIKSQKYLEITIPKIFINASPNKPTKIYLIKGDQVEILEEKNGWLRIRYYGKKLVDGWIKKSDLK
jgi:hypothetical protein